MGNEENNANIFECIRDGHLGIDVKGVIGHMVRSGNSDTVKEKVRQMFSCIMCDPEWTGVLETALVATNSGKLGDAELALVVAAVADRVSLMRVLHELVSVAPLMSIKELGSREDGGPSAIRIDLLRCYDIDTADHISKLERGPAWSLVRSIATWKGAMHIRPGYNAVILLRIVNMVPKPLLLKSMERHLL